MPKTTKKVTVQVKNENLYEALARIQKELKAPKSQYNSFSKFNYRSCEDILEAVKPLLSKFVLTLSDEVIIIGDRYYIKAVVSLLDGEKFIQSVAYAREPLARKGMDDSQITGSASSYARKFALSGLFAIDDTKDSDTVKTKEDKKNKEGLLTGGELKAIASVLQDINNAKILGELENIGLKIKGMKLNKNQTIILREAYANKSKKFQPK